MSSSDKVRPLRSFNHKDIFTPNRSDMTETPSDENGHTSHSRPRRWILLSHGSRSFLLPSLRKDLDYHKMRLNYQLVINGDF